MCFFFSNRRLNKRGNTWEGPVVKCIRKDIRFLKTCSNIMKGMDLRHIKQMN